jgi:hypothetical protein
MLNYVELPGGDRGLGERRCCGACFVYRVLADGMGGPESWVLLREFLVETA